ncbi:hypothetical protein ACJJTC_005675 [Scirpophaga incertulas]
MVWGKTCLVAESVENQPPNSSLTVDNGEKHARVIKHHRTVSLPGGCAFHEPLRVVHERTRSAPLEDTAAEAPRAPPWPRRASTGARLAKLSPAHRNAGPLRSRCDSMPSRACSSYETERPPPRHNDFEGLDMSRDEPDTMAEWYRTPRIPEEPDLCDVSRDLIRYRRTTALVSRAGAWAAWVRAALAHVVAGRRGGRGGRGGRGRGVAEDADGYLPMAPAHDALPALLSASSGSVCSGTPSTDPRFR